MANTILLVDDHPVFRQGLRHLLTKEADLLVVGEAGDGRIAVELALREKPDIVIMDINMPHLDGIEATRRITAALPHTRVVALSVNSEKDYVRRIFEAGASGYILKECIPEEMIAGIRSVLSGASYLSKAITTVLVSDYKAILSNAAPEADRGISSLLYAKLHRPPIASHIIPRVRLIEFLEKGVPCSMTLIAAPAGYGKSVLASHWLEVSDFPGAWLTLDSRDNEFHLFIRYIAETIQRLFPQKALTVKSLLDAGNLPSRQTAVRYLINDLEALSERFILVLDDYHLIRNAEIHDFVTELLAHAMPRLHLVLLTRRDPPLPLTSLRSRGMLTEISMRQLRFSVSETRAFLERILHITVADKTAEILEEKMEGWVTGLHLAALSIRNEADQARVAAELLETSKFVRDYLIEEVISQMPPRFSRPLLQTAVLDRFCAPLCNALSAETLQRHVTEPQASGREFLDWLNESHMFVIPLDAGGIWFRYHHVFQQLLQDQLVARHTADDIRGLRLRAAEWFAETGLIDEAITYALAAGDEHAAASIVEENRLAVIEAERWHLLGVWLGRLPHPVRQERPGLLLVQAWMRFFSGQIAEIVPIIERVEFLIGDASTAPETAAEIHYFRGLICYFSGEGKRSVTHFVKAADLFSVSAHSAMRAEATQWTGVALHLDGRKEAALRRLHDGIRGSDITEGRMLSRLIFGLCVIHMLDGNRSQAFQEGLRLREVCRSNRLYFAETWSMYVLGNASFHLLSLDAARQYFDWIVENRTLINRRATIDAMVGLAITCQLMGRTDEADAAIRLAREHAQGMQDYGHLEIVRACEARLALLRNDIDSALRWQRSVVRMPGNQVLFFFMEIPALTECRVLTAIGSDTSLQEAIDRLDALLSSTKAWFNAGQQMEIMALQALALYRQGRSAEALTVLETLVEMAEPGGSVRLFVELGPPMAGMLQQLMTKNIAVRYIGKLLAAFRDRGRAEVSDVPVASPLSSVPGPEVLVEPLTHREMDILELLSLRLQSKEIAERLFISIETVKSHLKRIYQKLNADGRRQAVDQARRLGIL